MTATAPERAHDALGRTPGRRPPLPSWAPLAWFATLATALATVVLALVGSPGALDQVDPAYQRDGLLRDGPVVDEVVVGVEFGGRPVVLLFEREAPDAQRLSQWAAAVPEGADVVLVLPEPTSSDLPVQTVADPLNTLADALRMPEPVDGGRPVGYGVVDSDRVVRYVTLDPQYLSNAFEVTTIVKAVR